MTGWDGNDRRQHDRLRQRVQQRLDRVTVIVLGIIGVAAILAAILA